MPPPYDGSASASAIYAYAGNDPINMSDPNGHAMNLGGLLHDHPNDRERDRYLERQAKQAEERRRAALEANPDAGRDVLDHWTNLAADYRSLKGLSYDTLHEQHNKELMGQAAGAVVAFGGARVFNLATGRFETSKLEVEARRKFTGVQNNELTKKVDDSAMPMKRSFSPSERAAGLEKAKDAAGVPKCQYCGKTINPAAGGPNSYEADHIRPYSKGGPTTQDNLGPSCRTCNRSKGNQTLEDWYR